MASISTQTESEQVVPSTEQADTSINREILGIQLLGTGSYAPDNEVLNEDLAQMGFDADWIKQRTGILARRHAFEDEATSDLAIAAAEKCIKNAGVSASDIDMIFVATMTPDHYTPSTACLLQRHLGCVAGAMDMNAACSGFMYAMITACQFVRSRSSKLALVVGADKMSCVVDDRDMKTFPLFGDGAGAAIIRLGDPAAENTNSESVEPKGILAWRLASAGELAHTLVVPGGGSRKPCSEEVVSVRDQYLKMEGKAVFKWAVRLIPEVIDLICNDAGVSKEEIDLFILHQANRRILDAAIENVGIDPGRFFVNLDQYGNTSAASIPVALDEAIQQGRIKPGSKVFAVWIWSGVELGRLRLSVLIFFVLSVFFLTRAKNFKGGFSGLLCASAIETFGGTHYFANLRDAFSSSDFLEDVKCINDFPFIGCGEKCVDDVFCR